MKKFVTSVISVLCMSVWLFFNAASAVEAAERDMGYWVDPRPNYTIFVNRALNCVSVVQQEADGSLTPVRAMVCSCGREGHETPDGVFQTSDYYEWRLMVDDTYGRYAVRFNGKILFHSVPYIETSPDTLEWEEYNKLGENASLGCVRLSAEDAKWIYDNCRQGTTVVVYADSVNAGLLGLEKPAAIEIPEDSPARGWDPTDVTPGNPWLTPVVVDSTLVSLPTPFAGTIDEFNYTDYADRYPDLKEAFGYDKVALYVHYIVYGINEGRIAFAY